MKLALVIIAVLGLTGCDGGLDGTCLDCDSGNCSDCTPIHKQEVIT